MERTLKELWGMCEGISKGVSQMIDKTLRIPKAWLEGHLPKFITTILPVVLLLVILLLGGCGGGGRLFAPPPTPTPTATMTPTPSPTPTPTPTFTPTPTSTPTPTPTPTPTNTPTPTATPAPTNTPTPTPISLPLSPISAIPVYVFPEPPKTLGKITKYEIKRYEEFDSIQILVPPDGIETQNVYMPFDGFVLYYEIDVFNISLQIYSGMKDNDVVISLMGPFIPQKILKKDDTVKVKKGTLIATIDKSKAIHETILFGAYGGYKGNLPDDVNVLFTYLPEMFK